jgi:protein-tyrosine phosphatase
MIDIHCHILPGVDDGAKSLADSFVMLQNAIQAGIHEIVLTPHYIKGSRYSCDNAAKRKLMTELNALIKKNNLPIRIHLGNEIFIDEDILDLLKHGQVVTLAKSRYVLIELPVHDETLNSISIMFELVSNGYVPIIAHPERYEYFQKNPSNLERYFEIGCLAQGDYRSLFGKYGRHAKRTLKYLIKHRQIDLLASDVHHPGDDYNLKKAKKKVTHLTKNSHLTRRLFEVNPDKIIKNEII